MGCVKTEIEPTEKLPINFIGDSLTEPIGTDPTDLSKRHPLDFSYPSFLQSMLIGRKMTNIGLGSQNAEQIIARQGGIPVYLTVANNRLNGSNIEIPVDSITSIVGGVETKNNILSRPDNIERIIRGTINGIKCDLIRRARGSDTSYIEFYYLKPITESKISIPPKSRFYPDQTYFRQDSCISVIWIGRNNELSTPSARNNVLEIIKKAVEFNKYNKFVILGILKDLNGYYGTPRALADDTMSELIKKTYPNNFIDMVPPNSKEMEEINYIPSRRDSIDISNGVFPIGMRRDIIHMANQELTGNKIIANRVYKKLKELNY